MPCDKPQELTAGRYNIVTEPGTAHASIALSVKVAEVPNALLELELREKDRVLLKTSGTLCSDSQPII